MAQTAELEKTGKEVLDLQKDLEELRAPKEPMYRDILKLVYPGLSAWDAEGGDSPERKDIWDDTAVRFNRLMGNGLMGFTMSPSIRWFSLGLFGKYGEPLRALDIPGAATWLRTVEDCILMVFARSNFYNQGADAAALAGSFGSPVVWADIPRFTGEDWSFQCLHPGHTWFSEDERKTLNTFSRRLFHMGKDLMKNFPGIETSNPTLWSEWKTLPRQRHRLFHVTHPNDQWAPGVRIDKRGKKFRSYYVDSAGNVLEDGGMDESRFLGWRWQTASDQVYAESVSMDAMGSIKILQQMKKTHIEKAQLDLKPPLNVPRGLMKEVRIVPEGRNPYDRADQKIEPMKIGGGGTVISDAAYQNQVSYVIDCYHGNLWLMLDRQTAGSRMTAYEVSQRMGEKASALAPILARHQSEFADPLISMVFNVEMKAGRIPPPPPSLRSLNAKLVPHYLGPLSVAQRRNGTMESLAMGLAAISPIAAIRTEIFDHLNFDQWVRIVAETSGIPGEAVNDPAMVQTIRQSRIQAEAQARQQAAQLEFMKAYKGTTKAGEPGSPGAALSEAFGIRQPEQFGVM